MIVVIGIGQTLRGDDAAGVRAVQFWQKNYPHTSLRSDVQVVIEELPGLALLELLSGASAVVIADAVRSGARPGEIYQLELTDLAAFTPGSSSAHGWGLAETLALGRILGIPDLPEMISLVGIEASELNAGASLSPLVADSIERAADLIESLVTGWLTRESSGN